MAHVAPWKKDEVKGLVELIKANPVLGIVNVGGIPAKQMAKMRSTLREDATVKVTKNTLLMIALKEVGKEKSNLHDLTGHIDGQTAIIATSMNPFRLYKRLEGSKTKAPARGGEVAPEDIGVKKGDTPFKPGPIVGELQKAGIPARIDQGKVVISADKVLVKQGDRIPQDVAAMLTRLEIFPLTVGLNIQAVYEDGTVYDRSALSVDYMGSLLSAHAQAVNLSVFAGYLTKQTTDIILATAYARALALAGVAVAKNPDALGDDAKARLANRATASSAPAAAAEEAKAEEPEEEQVSEEDAMAGLGSLFG